MKSKPLSALLLAIPLVSLPVAATACSLVFLNENDIAKVAVRTMDLPAAVPEVPKLVVFPRGLARDTTKSVLPNVHAKAVGLSEKTMDWNSKFGSIGIVSFGGSLTDGLNERGLAGHLLILEETVYEPKDTRKELGESHWLTYVLDNFATVSEAVSFLQDNKEFRIVPVTSPEQGVTHAFSSHLALEDSSGDSAIFEFVNGKLVIHHGKQYQIMTNDPAYAEMLERMKKYKPFGGAEPLPGESPPGEYRFARLAAYYKLLPQPKDYREAIAGAFSLMRIAQIPFRDRTKDLSQQKGPTPSQFMWAGVQTNWVSAMDLTHLVLYVNSTYSPSLFWIEMKDLRLKAGSPIMYLDPHDIRLAGNAVNDLRKLK